MKIKIIDKKILKTFSIIVAFISSIIGILAVAINFDKKYAWIWFVTWAFLLLLVYFILYLNANNKRCAHFKINDTNINVFIGDIFDQKDGLKVIPMNEYFDTQVDDKIVSKTSLHGRYLLNYCKDIGEFERNITTELIPICINKKRNVERHNNKYDLGSLVEKDGFVLTAFTKFDDNNKAFLYGKDYLYFWGSFWTNIDTIFAGRNIFIPLFGSGITRFKEYKPTKQELLESILFTMKNCGFRNTYSSKSVNIIIYKDDANEIDFYHLNERFGN